MASSPILGAWHIRELSAQESFGPAQHTFSLNSGWRFGRNQDATPAGTNPDETALALVTFPHCVAPLSWQNWQPSAWEDLWVYRRHFSTPAKHSSHRVFLQFERVMGAATLSVNGHALPQHLGGFLPFEREITDLLQEKDNLISLAVDSRWLSVPPAGSPKGPVSIDYLLPGGVNGSAHLRVLPAVFLSDVFAKPVDVLSQNRRLEISCQLDAGTTVSGSVLLQATLRDQHRTIASTSKSATLSHAQQPVLLTLDSLRDITLWDVDNPQLYELVVTLLLDGKPVHDFRTRIGFRDARFELDAFLLNGRRLQLFGLNRHELYPYMGFAAPARAFRKDAEILRRDFNCNVVRCSHYPQSEAFLNACDELGLMVWEETPGWQYLGDQTWQDLVVRDVDAMVRRDRNHPSVIIWGVRVNESRNDPSLYTRTRDIAKSLDDSRPTSGTMTSGSRKTWQEQWHQDVFAFDSYHANPDGSVFIEPAVSGVPYLITECVGGFNYGLRRTFSSKYRRAADPELQAKQALLHAQAHDRGASTPRCAGVIAWCAFDYASLINAYDGVKCPGVADIFRIPKLGASVYLAQADARERPVIAPSFYWDFGPQTPTGPGKQAAIYSNCDRIEIFLNGQPHSVLHPHCAAFPHLKHPPFFADFEISSAGKPELRIDGYLENRQVLSRSFSADHSTDRLLLQADDTELDGDGSDATRLMFASVDKFGAWRPFVTGDVHFKLSGPAIIVGDNPFSLGDSGGVGAVWIKTLPDSAGRIQVEAVHALLGSAHVQIKVRKRSVLTL